MANHLITQALQLNNLSVGDLLSFADRLRADDDVSADFEFTVSTNEGTETSSLELEYGV